MCVAVIIEYVFFRCVLLLCFKSMFLSTLITVIKWLLLASGCIVLFCVYVLRHVVRFGDVLVVEHVVECVRQIQVGGCKYGGLVTFVVLVCVCVRVSERLH